MSGSRRENAYVNFDLHKKSSFLYFLYRCKCILKCLAQHRMRADFSGENVIERGTCFLMPF